MHELVSDAKAESACFWSNPSPTTLLLGGVQLAVTELWGRDGLPREVAYYLVGLKAGRLRLCISELLTIQQARR
jgi:hypothetical protein